jgi:hypothetical protein
MRRSNELEQRLIEWGREYGGGRYEDNGWHGVSNIYPLTKYHGRPPQGLVPPRGGIRTRADDVQDAVMALQDQPEGFRPSMVLRVEYLEPGKPFLSKQQGLRKIGQGMGRSDYYKSLKIARVHVAAWLHIRFDNLSDEMDEEEGLCAHK